MIKNNSHNNLDSRKTIGIDLIYKNLDEINRYYNLLIFRQINLPMIQIKKTFGVKKLHLLRPRFKCTSLTKYDKKIKIFNIKKVSKILGKISESQASSKYYTDRKKKIEELMEDIKRKIELLVSKQQAIDIRDIKLYHKLSLEYKHNLYLTPLTSLKNSADNNSNEQEELNKSNESSKEKETKSFLPNSLRIISPYNKETFCNCKKSQCQKNYCECRKNNEMCYSKNCMCENCNNQC